MLCLERGHYLGAIGIRRTFRAARVIETTYTRDQPLCRHAHAHVYVAVIVNGALTETAAGREHVLSRGHVVFNEAGEAHHDRVLAAGTRCLNLELRPAFLRCLRAGGFTARAPLLYTQAGVSVTAVGRLDSAIHVPESELDFVEALVDLLAGAVARRERPRRDFEWLPRTLEFLHDSFRERVLLETVAGVAGIQITHLCRSFRSATGCTIGDYVRRLRADLAHRHLSEGRLPIAAIAAECGYADQSHMTREMRRYYGRCPSRLRRRSVTQNRANPVQDGHSSF